jgi:GT2 family glycosyltransferase
VPRGPRVVLGIPAHDSERFLAETLASVAAQDWPSLEIVISDDASSDATPAICREFAARDRRVRLLRHPERVGWVANYNALLAHATGEYFLWVPHDDLYEPTYVSEMVARLEAQPDAVLAYSAVAAIDAAGRVGGAWSGTRRLGAGVPRLRRALRYLWWAEDEKFIPFRGVIRTAALRRVGGLAAGAWGAFADNLWLFRLVLDGGFEHVPRTLCRKRLHPASVSARQCPTLGTWRAYVGAHQGIVRAAGLPPLERRALLAAVTLREAAVIAHGPARALRRRVARHPALNRLAWYLAPTQLPRRLGRLIRIPGRGGSAR